MTNIALVVLDTLRKDSFDDHFGWLDGERYEAAYSTANWTGPAHASLFTGKYGSTVGVSSKHRSLDCGRDVLAERLQEAGYTTRGWSANPNVSAMTEFDRGFGKFLGPSAIKTGNPNLLDIEKALREYGDLSKYQRYARVALDALVSDCETIPSIKHGIKKARDIEDEITDDGASVVLKQIHETDFGNDEFLFVNLMEAHTPYYPPEGYREFDEPVKMPFGEAYFGVDEPELVCEAYDAAARYLSDIYREIFDELSKSFDYIITLSDHGELLGEHGNKWNHVCGIYPELTHVPLVLSGPEFDGKIDHLTNLLDVHATISELAGIDNTGEGTSLVSKGNNRGPFVAEYRGPFAESVEKAKNRGMDLDQFDTDLFALIESEYYGFEDFDDWVEIGNPSSDTPSRKLHNLIDKYGMRPLKETEMDIGEEKMEQLENLGYV